MKTTKLSIAIALIMSGALASSAAFAAKPPDAGGGGGGGGQPPVTESGANNLSFPVILSDNATPTAFPVDGAWRFATITDPTNPAVCAQETNTTVPVPTNILCYHGGKVTVVSETGEIFFDDLKKVWWLQKRPQNFWKALSVGHDVSTPLVVSAVDVGDLLESSPAIQARQIRVEFNMLQSVPADDPELGHYVVTDWTSPVPVPCVVPDAAGESIGCLAALGMSGAVPGTEQSGNEIQGTDFGPGPTPGLTTGTLTLLDPTTVRTATLADGTTTLPINALVYSNCARLVIQKIAGNATWNETTGQWAGAGVGEPLVNTAVYPGGSSPWAVEITSSGSIVYGYNWNAKTASTGTYRLTFVLDGNDAEGPQCSSTLATKFESPSTGSLGTQLVNLGEANLPSIMYAGDSDLGDEGGLAYLDLTLSTKGGGGGKPAK